MRVTFVNPPLEAVATADLAPPLWALLLGRVARDAGAAGTLLDFNLAGLETAGAPAADFYAEAAARIAETSADLVAFSGMAVNSHVSLELARHVKQLTPGVKTLFGGPHFGAAAAEFVGLFPWADAVFVGEAEHSFRDYLAAEASGVTGAVAGAVVRTAAVVVDGGPPRRPTVGEIPSPLYDLADVGRYFKANPRRLLDFDGARRGCRFACTFCYSPAHYGQGARPPDDDRFEREWAAAARAGARTLFVVQDNFVNSPGATVALCESLARRPEEMTFHCYATLAQLTPPVIAALAGAGCRGVYVGVDAVHPDDRAHFAKKLYSSEPDMLRRAAECQAAGVVPTLSFMVQEVDSPAAKARFEATLAVAAAAAERGCPIRLNTLALYPGSAAHAAHAGLFRPSDLKARLTMDVPAVVRDNPFAVAAPGLFPFHATHRPPADHGRFLLGVQALYVLAAVFPAQLRRFAEGGRSWDLAERLTAGLDPCAVGDLPLADRSAMYLDRFCQLVKSATISARQTDCPVSAHDNGV